MITSLCWTIAVRNASDTESTRVCLCGDVVCTEQRSEGTSNSTTPRPPVVQGLDALCRQTHFSRRQLQSLYRLFKQVATLRYVHWLRHLSLQHVSVQSVTVINCVRQLAFCAC